MDQNLFAEKFATKLTQLGLRGPALLLLEAHKPLAFVGSQLLLVAQPTLNLLISPFYTQGMIDLLADPKHLEQFLTQLEQPSTTRGEAVLAHSKITLNKNLSKNPGSGSSAALESGMETRPAGFRIGSKETSQ